jgi:hypothetical protein
VLLLHLMAHAHEDLLLDMVMHGTRVAIAKRSLFLTMPCQFGTPARCGWKCYAWHGNVAS